MTPDTERLLRQGYDAFRRQDFPAFLALVDPEIEWTEPPELPYGGTYRGHAGLAELAAKWGETYAEMVVEPQEFIAAGDRAAVIGTYRLRTRGPGATRIGASQMPRTCGIWCVIGSRRRRSSASSWP
jgi:ketosteroid isomerase-like protein